MFETQRGKPKLYSLGYVYIIDKKNENTINWKCVDCKARAKTNNLLYDQPIITVAHTHTPNTKLKELLNHRSELKKKSQNTRDAPRRDIREVTSTVDDDVVANLPTDDASRY